MNNSQAVVDVGYGGSVQGYINKMISQRVHGYYLMTDERSAKVTKAYDVIIRGCFCEITEQSSEAPLIYRNSFDIEKLLSSNKSQLEYYEEDNNAKINGHYRDQSSAEIECSDTRNLIKKGALDFAYEARRIRESILPDYKPPCRTSKLLIESFLAQKSQREKNLMSEILLDDYYCGRDIVS